MIFSVPGDPVIHRLGHKIVLGGYRGYRAVLLNDLTHDLGLELLGIFRCWPGIYPIDSREEKLPLSEKHHALHPNTAIPTKTHDESPKTHQGVTSQGKRRQPSKSYPTAS